MRKLILAASCVLAMASTAATAQRYPGDGGPPPPGWRGGPPPPPAARQQPPPVVVQRPRPPAVVYAPPPPPPVWRQGAYPYKANVHDICQRKAWRLRWSERRAGADGVFTVSEQSEIRALRRDLRRTCGDWRWRG